MLHAAFIALVSLTKIVTAMMPPDPLQTDNNNNNRRETGNSHGIDQSGNPIFAGLLGRLRASNVACVTIHDAAAHVSSIVTNPSTTTAGSSSSSSNHHIPLSNVMPIPASVPLVGSDQAVLNRPNGGSTDSKKYMIHEWEEGVRNALSKVIICIPSAFRSLLLFPELACFCYLFI